MGHLKGGRFLGEALLTVMAATLEGMHDRTITFQGAACFISANISLTKAGQWPSPKVKGQSKE